MAFNISSRKDKELKMKKDTNKNKKSGSRLHKILIVCMIVIGIFLTINIAVSIASNKYESAFEEEKSTVNEKWDNFMDWLNE